MKKILYISIGIVLVIIIAAVPTYSDIFNKRSVETIPFDSIYAHYFKADSARIDSLTSNNIITTTLHVTDIFTEPDHIKQSFTDSVVVIAGGSHVQITNSRDSIYRVLDIKGIIHLRGDTILITKSGGYNLYCAVHGYATNGVDWEVHTARKRSGVTTYGEQVISFTTTGATNRNGDSFTFYNEYLPGDKIWLVISKISVTVADFTIVSSNFNVQQIYMK